MKSALSHRLLFSSLAIALSAGAAVAEDLPILKSTSKLLTIVDGDHVKGDHWVLMPEKDPDVYYVEIPLKPHAVTFRSDVDSITFDMQPGDRRDFVVLLDGKVACRTQIRAEYRKLQPYSRAGADPGPSGDAIPFRLGDNSKIYIEGRLNGGPALSFQFDLGCGGSIIKKGSVPRANMEFDGTTTLINSDGRNVVPSSSENTLEVGPLRWEGLSFAVGDNMTHREDGLLGNVLFQGKVVEIDYDRRVMVIRDAPPAIDPRASKHEIILDGVIPYIRGSLAIAGERREGWFMFDTGAYTSILSHGRASPAGKMLIEARKMLGGGGAAEADPRLTIGDRAFADFNYTVGNSGGEEDRLGLLGNDLLKRFNVVLDNRGGAIYLTPNGLTGEPYANPEYYVARVIAAAALALAAACGWLVFWWRSRRRARRAAQPVA